MTILSRSDRNIPKRMTTLAKGGGRVKQIETIREALKIKAGRKRAARIKDGTRDGKGSCRGHMKRGSKRNI